MKSHASQWSSSCQGQTSAKTLRNLENLEELCILMRGKRGEVRDVKLSWKAELCCFGKERNNRWKRSKSSRKKVLGVGRAKQGDKGSRLWDLCYWCFQTACWTNICGLVFLWM